MEDYRIFLRDFHFLEDYRIFLRDFHFFWT